MVEAQTLTDILELHENKVTELVGSACEHILNNDYYKNYLLPNLKNISSNRKELEKKSEFITSLIEKIVNTDNELAWDMKSLVPHFVEQYFDFLHTESQNTIKKVATLEAKLEKSYFDDSPSSRLGNELKDFLNDLKHEGLNEHLTDILDIATNIYHERDVKKYLQDVPSILKELKKEKLDVQNYIYLSKKISKKDSFPLSQQEIVEKLKILEKEQEYKDVLIRYYAANIRYYIESRNHGSFIFKKLVRELNELKEKNSKEEIFKLYNDAIKLGNKDINGKEFIEHTFSKTFKLNQEEIINYALDLSHISSNLSNDFLSSAQDIFNLPDRKKRKALLVGKYLSKKHGEFISKYFEMSPYILCKGEKEFAKWIRHINDFSKIVSSESDEYLNKYLDLSSLLLNKENDPILASYLKLNRELNNNLNVERNKKILDGHTILELMFSYMKTFIDNRLDIDLCTNNMIKAINLESPNKEKILNFYEFLDYYHYAIDLTERNIIEDKYWEILPSIFKNKLKNVPLDNLEDLINSDLSLTEKNSLLQEYSAIYNFLHIAYKLDLNSEWKLKYKENMINRIYEDSMLTKDISNFSMDKLIAFSEILDNNEEVDRLNLKTIIERTLTNKPFSKVFNLGKTYGKASISGLCKLDDPLILTENLVYGLISRDDKKRKDAEQYFESNKLKLAREFINPVELFKLIKNDLSKLQEGSKTSAENILNVIYSKYKNKECVSDMVIKVQSLFAENERIDGLEIKMQEGTYKDLFDNRETLCCAFFPTGENAHASFNYLLDDNIGLLHILPRKGETTSNPIGVAILVNTYDPKTKEKYLLVDSVEAGSKIDKVRKSIWMPLVKNSIYELAKDMKYDKIMYNSIVGNSKSESFVNYLLSDTGKEKTTTKLYKKQSKESQIIKNAKEQLKEYKKWCATGDYDRDYFDTNIVRNLRPYLESFEVHSSSFTNPDAPIKDFGGKVEGIVFEVK